MAAALAECNSIPNPKQESLPSSSPGAVIDIDIDIDIDMNQCLSTSYEEYDHGGQENDSNNNATANNMHDLIGLTHLDEPAILHALRLRYDNNIIYTSTGPILIAVNPFQKMDHLYSTEVMERYRLQGEGGGVASSRPLSSPKNNMDGKKPLLERSASGDDAPSSSSNEDETKMPPHAYKTADDSYRAMKRGLENNVFMKSSKKNEEHHTPTNQSILVSGESGAGKTVTTKIVLNYFAMLSKQTAKEEELLRSNSILSPRSLSRLESATSTTNTEVADGGEEEVVGIEQQVLQSNPILEAFGNARTLRNDNSSRFGKYIDISFSSSGKLSGAKIDTYLLEKVRLIHPSTGERNYHVFYQLLEHLEKPEHLDERDYLGLVGLGIDNFKLLNCTGGTIDRRDGVVDGEMHQEMLDAMMTIGFSTEEISSILRLITAILHCGNISFAPHYHSDSAGNSDGCYMEKTHNSITAARLLGVKWDDLSNALTYRDIFAGNDVIHSPLDKVKSQKACESLMKAIYGATFDYIVQRINESISRQNNFSAGTSGAASIGVLDIFGFEIFNTNNFEQLCINYTNEALQQQFNKYVFKLEQEEYEREGINWKFIQFPDNQDCLDLIDRKHTGILALLDEQCIMPSSTDKKMARYLYSKCKEHSRFSASSTQRADFQFSIRHYAGNVEYQTDHWLEKNNDQLPVKSSNLLMESEFSLVSKIQQYIRKEDRDGRGSVATKSVGAQFAGQLRILRARIDQTVPHYIRCLKPNDAMVRDSFDPEMITEQLRCGGVLEAVRVSRAGYPTRYPHNVFLTRFYVLGYGQTKDRLSVAVSKDKEVKNLVGKIALDIWKAERDKSPSNGAPETAEEFNMLDFSSQCAVAGLQLGRTKVFLRREALDRIEALRTQKFGIGALAIQRIVRGRQARSYYKLFRRQMMHYAIVIQRAYRRYQQALFLTPAAIKLQALARGGIIRMRLSSGSKNASKRLWVPYTEFENLQTEIGSVKMERDQLLEANATMESSLKSLKNSVTDITETVNLENELREKTQLHAEILALKSQVLEKDELQKELTSVRQQLDTEKEKCKSDISSLKAQLHESKAVEDRLNDFLESTKKSHADEKARAQDEKDSMVMEKQERSKQIERLESELECADKRVSALGSELGDEKKVASREKDELDSKISTLEIELSNSKKDEERLVKVIELLKSDHSDALDNLQTELNGATESAELKKVESSTKISTLETKLSESKAEEKRLASVVESLKTGHAYAVKSMQAKINDAINAVLTEREQLSSEMSSLETQMNESKEEEKRLADVVELLKTSHAEAIGDLQTQLDDAKSAASQDKEMMSSLETKLAASKEEKEKLTKDAELLTTAHAAQLDGAKKAAREEQDQLQSKISTLEAHLSESKTETKNLVSVMESMKSSHAEEINSVKSELDDATKAADEEKEQLSANISFLEAKVSEAKAETGRLDNEIKSMQSTHSEAMISLEDKLDDTKKAAADEKEQLTSKLSSLRVELEESKDNEGRFNRTLVYLETSHKAALKNVENEKENLSKVNTDLSEQIKNLSASLNLANERVASLGAELDDVKKSAFDKQEELRARILSLETELGASKKVKATLSQTVETLRTSSVENLKTAASDEMGKRKVEMHSRLLDEWKQSASQQNEQLSSKISSLMNDLTESKEKEGRQDSIISMMRKEYEEYQTNNPAGESKTDPNDQAFYDMLRMIQLECSDIIAKSKSMANELESSHGVHLLSGQAANLELKKRNMLNTSFSNTVAQVVVFGVVRKLLISSTALESADMDIEVSLL